MWLSGHHVTVHGRHVGRNGALGSEDAHVRPEIRGTARFRLPGHLAVIMMLRAADHLSDGHGSTRAHGQRHQGQAHSDQGTGEASGNPYEHLVYSCPFSINCQSNRLGGVTPTQCSPSQADRGGGRMRLKGRSPIPMRMMLTLVALVSLICPAPSLAQQAALSS